jgi:hypothetical protein
MTNVCNIHDVQRSSTNLSKPCFSEVYDRSQQKHAGFSCLTCMTTHVKWVILPGQRPANHRTAFIVLMQSACCYCPGGYVSIYLSINRAAKCGCLFLSPYGAGLCSAGFMLGFMQGSLASSSGGLPFVLRGLPLRG